MYGDIREAGDCQLKVLEFGTPIPFEFVEDEEQMKYCRSMFRVNQDIPGALEIVHPNKFLPSKLIAPPPPLSNNPPFPVRSETSG
jgi:hypothetical protein